MEVCRGLARSGSNERKEIASSDESIGIVPAIVVSSADDAHSRGSRAGVNSHR